MNRLFIIAFLDRLGGVAILLQYVAYRAACSIYNLCMYNVHATTDGKEIF